MFVSYKSVLKILCIEYNVYSITDFIEQNRDIVNQSLTTAHILEDYRFLSVMTHENDTYDCYDIFINKHNPSAVEPIVLERNVSIDLFPLAKIFCDSKIEKKEFLQVIEEEAIGQDMDPCSHYLQFDLYITRINTFREQSVKKVYRNDPCPCGSGKKYKQCHGITVP